MANDAVFELGRRLMDRIKSASYFHGVDTRLASERMLCEELSRGLSKHLVPKYMIKGGLLHPQVADRPVTSITCLSVGSSRTKCARHSS